MRQKGFGPSRLSAAVVAVAFLVLLGPLLLSEIPPLTDYPNHLARYWLISGGSSDPLPSRFYRIDWSNASTNVALDWVAALLAPWLPGMAIGRILLFVAAGLPPIGLVALNVGLFRRATPWQAIFPIAAWSATFLMGFLSFQVGLGLALLFAAADPLVHPKLRRFAVVMRAPLGLVLIANHLFALVFYAVLLAGLAFGREPVSIGAWRERLWRAARAASWCLIPSLLYVAFAHALPVAATHGGLGEISFGNPAGKTVALFSPLVSYNVLVELPLAVCVVALIVWLARRGELEMHAGLLVAAAGLMLLCIVSPHAGAGSSWIDDRFPIMAFLCVLAGSQLSVSVSPRRGLAIALAAMSLVTVRTAWVGWNWRETESNISAVRRALAQAPAGATVLPLQHLQSLAARLSAPPGRYMFNLGDPTFRHYALLAIPLRQAFVPTLFALHGKQPIQVRGAWDLLVDHSGGDLASVHSLDRPPGPADPSYLRSWRERFSYILVLNADMADQDGPFRPPPGVEAVSDQGFAQLWRVAPRPGGGSAGFSRPYR